MNDLAIKVENLSKDYVIGARESTYQTLRESLGHMIQAPIRRLRTLQRKVCEEQKFRALDDVNFEVRQGDVVGIVGRNGAGKSTLLKILSQITAPTSGRVTLNGRVASLLEVGTGFHPELTGRENIYLNGAILGMSRKEISQKFDEIVDFAEVERFLDTPVKRYSSGMHVRLAFSVAAHLEPDILLVDEVLAVGDAQFQKKSQSKLKAVSSSGQTVLFVSHNMSAISSLCRTGVYLHGGKVSGTGDISEVLTQYADTAGTSDCFKRTGPILSDAALTEGSVSYRSGFNGELPTVVLDLTIVLRRELSISIGVRMKDALGTPVGYISLGFLQPAEMLRLSAGTHNVQMVVAGENLASGGYGFSVDICEPGIVYYDRVEDCLALSIEPLAPLGRLQPLVQAWGCGSFIIPPLNVTMSRR